MNRLIPILVIGSLAFTLASKPVDINLPETGPSVPVLSGVFPRGNVPINPNGIKLPKFSIPAFDFKQSNSQANRRIIAKIPRAQTPYDLKTSGKVYKYEVPIDDEGFEDQVQGPYGKELLGTEISGQKSTVDVNVAKRQSDEQYLQLQQNQEDDGNNGKENTKEESGQEKNSYRHTKVKPIVNPDFSSIQDLQLEKSKKKYAGHHGNQSQVIQGAGTGFHQDVAHPHPEAHYENGHDGIVGHEVGPHPNHEHGHDAIGPVVGPHHELVGHDVGYGHGYPHKSYSKPLKPSVVHRDPHDSYDHHDKIRTLDKDHLDEHKGHDGYGHEFQPYLYDMYKVPECAYKNKHYYNLTFCLEDHAYPIESILWAIHQSGPYAHQLLSDVTYQSADNLVSGLTRAEEEGYTYKHYFGGTHSQHTHLEQYKPPYHGYTYSADYFKKGGYICPSDIYYGRPKRAMNTYGKWKVIVNVDHIPKPHYGHENGIHKRGIAYGHKGHGIHHKPYTQTIRLEQCIYANAPCSYIDSHYHSRCIQKHNFVRLVSWTHEEGLHVDTFKMPIACSCHIRQPIHFYHESGHHVEAHGHAVSPVNVYEHHDAPVHAGKKRST